MTSGPHHPPTQVVEQYRALLAVSEAVISHRSLSELFRELAAQLASLVSFDYINVLLHDAERDVMRLHILEPRDGLGVQPGFEVAVEGSGAGWVWRTQQPLIVHDIDAEERFPLSTDLFRRQGILSFYSFPLTSAGRRLGAMGFGCRNRGGCGVESLGFLRQVARQVAVAVENALNFQSAQDSERQLARERDRLRLLLEINNAVVSHLDLKQLVRSVSASLRDVMPHDAAGIALYEPELNQLREYTNVVYKELGALREGETIPIEGTPAGEVFRTGRTMLVRRPDPEAYPADRYSLRPVEGGPRSACLALLASRGRKLGIVGVSSTQEGRFTEEDRELFGQLAGQIALALDNALNFERATKERERAETLLRVNNAITTSLDLRDLLRATSDCLRQYFKHDVAGMALHDPESGQLRVHTLESPEPSALYVEEGFLMPLEGSPAGLAYTSRRSVLVNRLDAWESPSPVVRRALAAGIRSSCNAPLVSHDRTLGAVVVASRRESAFTEADAELLEHIARQLAIAVENALQYREIEGLKNKLASEKLYLEEEIKSEYNFAEIVGQSAALRKILRQVETVAPTDSAVLLCGETGTGKELIARAIHHLSARRERTLVKLNCAAIPTGLLESELFGHEKGAFTGAIAQRVGRFELAHRGTLLLDEIGEIPLELQPKLLRVLQEQEFERLGSSRTVKTDARLIAATNCDLPRMVAEKRFRSDLFYRLNVFPVTIPPLRERTDDIPLLVGYFAQKHALRMNKRIESVPQATIEALCHYPWPGNVRELENFIERACILTQGAELQAPIAELRTTPAHDGASSPAPTPVPTPESAPTPSRPFSLAEAERAHIEEVLRQTGGVVGGKGGAAEILGLPISTLRGRMKKLGLM